MTKLTAKHSVYTSRFRITPESAKSMLNLPLEITFNSLKQAIKFLKTVKPVSNLIHFERLDSCNKVRTFAECSSRAMRKNHFSIQQDIYDRFEEAGFDIDEAGGAFFAIESSCLIRDKHKYHAKKIKCRIQNRLYVFYFDIKKTFVWNKN